MYAYYTTIGWDYIMRIISRRGAFGAAQGRKNLALVRQYLQVHPEAYNTEISEALGLSTHSVGRHRRVIEAEREPESEK